MNKTRSLEQQLAELKEENNYLHRGSGEKEELQIKFDDISIQF